MDLVVKVGLAHAGRFFQNLPQQGSRGLTITGGCFCVLGLGVLLLPQLGPQLATKPGSEILLAAVPALLGLGDGLINVQVIRRLYWDPVAFLAVIILTRSCAALRAADLGWIVGPGYSSSGYILEKNHEKPTWNHEKP